MLTKVHSQYISGVDPELADSTPDDNPISGFISGDIKRSKIGSIYEANMVILCS